MLMKNLTSEQILFIKASEGLMRKQAHKLFTEHYRVSVPFNTFRVWCQKLGVKGSSSDGKFTTETSPRWQKGLDPEEFKSHYTKESFTKLVEKLKESNKTAKVGDVHIKGGVPWVVTRIDYSLPYEQRRERLSRVIWEKHHGEIPDDCMIIHLNKNLLDCRIENLAMIPKKYRGAMLRWNKSTNAEVNKTKIQILDIEHKLKELT